jgi:hypothetical protein
MIKEPLKRGVHMGSRRHWPDGGEQTSPETLTTLTPSDERKYKKLDDLKVVADERRRGRTAVSINGEMGRIVLYAGSYKAMSLGARRKVEYVQAKMSPRYPRTFWICPCSENDIGAKHISTSGKTMLLSAKALIAKLGLTGQKTARFEAEWDQANEGLVVDLRRTI